MQSPLANQPSLSQPSLSQPDSPSSQVSVQVAGAELILMASRTAWWPAQSALFLADAHFGKAATFRKAGIPIPEGTTVRMLADLSAALSTTSARQLFILGDFIHSSTRSHRDFEADLCAWRQEHATLDITLIRGNHDRHCEEIFAKLDVAICRDDLELGPLTLCHDPLNSSSDSGNSFLVGGHIHPGYRLADRSSKTLPCFWQTRRCLVFPAFGQFTGLAPIRPARDDSIFAILDNQIAKVSQPCGPSRMPAG
jgi:DNA ligase-associated metallophosphoesterase